MPPIISPSIDPREDLRRRVAEARAARTGTVEGDPTRVVSGEQIDRAQALTSAPQPQGQPQDTDVEAIPQAAPAQPGAVQWSEDPTVRQGQVVQEVARRKEEIYRKKNPLAPSDWAGSMTAEDWAVGKDPSKIGGLQRKKLGMDREMVGNVNEAANYALETNRQQQIAQRRAEIQRQKSDVDAYNSAALERYKASGQKYYTDPATGRLKEVVDEQGRKQFDETPWQLDADPKTGQPVLMKRDRFGRLNLKPSIPVAPIDPTSDRMEHVDPVTGVRTDAGAIADFIGNPDSRIAQRALAANKRRVGAVNERDIKQIQSEQMVSLANLNTAKSERDNLDEQITELTTKAAATTDPVAQEKLANETLALTTKRDALNSRVTGKGDLAHAAFRDAARLNTKRAAATLELYRTQAEEIAALATANGVAPESLPSYKANMEGLANAQKALEDATAKFSKYEPASAEAPVATAPVAEAEGTTSKVAKSLARGATAEGIYAAGEGAARVFASSPVARGIDAVQDKITELVQGFPLTAQQKADRAARRTQAKAGTLAEKGDIAAAEYADQTAKLRDTLRKALPIDKEFAESKLGQITQGIGQAAGTLPMAAFGPAGLAAASVGQMYDEAYQDAKASGADDAVAHSAAMKYLPAAGLDFLSERLLVGKLMKPLVGKTTVGAVLKDILTSAGAEGIAEGAQQAYLNQIASRLEGYAPDRPFDKEVLDSMLVGAVVGGGVTATGRGVQAALPAGSDQQQFTDETVYLTADAAATPPPAGLGGLAAAAAGQTDATRAAAQAELDRIAAEEGAPAPQPSTAEEAAQLFAPELAERVNIPPPFKPAADSAAVFTEQQQAADAEAQTLAQGEAQAQTLVDQIQEITGKDRAEILATRTGKEIGQWVQDLQRDAEYYANPIAVDPERRSTELRTELETLDERWNQNIRQLVAETEIAQRKEVLAQARAELNDRKQAIEDELGRIDQVRQSPQGREGLTEQLTQEQRTAAEEARRLRTPDLEGRRDAIEQQLTEAERLRQSPQGATALAEQLASEQSPLTPEPAATPTATVQTPDAGVAAPAPVSIAEAQPALADLPAAELEQRSRRSNLLERYAGKTKSPADLSMVLDELEKQELPNGSRVAYAVAQNPAAPEETRARAEAIRQGIEGRIAADLASLREASAPPISNETQTQESVTPPQAPAGEVPTDTAGVLRGDVAAAQAPEAAPQVGQRVLPEARAERVATAAPEPVAPASRLRPEAVDRPVKIQVKQSETGQTVEIEMTAKKAEKMLSDHVGVLRMIRKCVGGK